MARSAQSENDAGTTIATCPGFASDASTMSAAAGASAAIRASVRTCLPASRAAIAMGAWR